MPNSTIEIQGFEIQKKPRMYQALMSGKWLLERATPSWRMKDPIKGFQRLVKEDRAREIAASVLDQQRSFPNSIVLATDVREFATENCHINLKVKTRFFVVDGQHRLWAQHYSAYDAMYSCIIHAGLSESQMAELFLEINDTQKRVPSSLRWDLVRLTRPEDDISAIVAADVVFALATDRESPLFQRIDLTGEQKEISLKQGSLAPEIKLLVSSRKSGIASLSYDEQFRIILQYLVAIKELDSEGWKNATSVFYKARVLRALLKLLPELITKIGKKAPEITFADFIPYLSRIDKSTLDPAVIVAMQGESGIKAIHQQILSQIFPKK
jgi:DGQHR domain-containing protein